MVFTEGQRVRMLVACQGDDANDVFRTYPPGAAGLIDQVDERGAIHVIVGPHSDESILVVIEAGVATAQMQALQMPTKIVAQAVSGGGIVLRDQASAIVGQLSLTQVPGGCAFQQATRDILVLAINAGQAERQVTHFKTGATYDVLPEALFQVSDPQEGLHGIPKGRIVEDGDKVTVYRNPEGKHFVRFPDEMVSPRFEDVQS